MRGLESLADEFVNREELARTLRPNDEGQSRFDLEGQSLAHSDPRRAVDARRDFFCYERAEFRSVLLHFERFKAEPRIERRIPRDVSKRGQSHFLISFSDRPILRGRNQRTAVASALMFKRDRDFEDMNSPVQGNQEEKADLPTLDEGDALIASAAMLIEVARRERDAKMDLCDCTKSFRSVVLDCLQERRVFRLRRTNFESGRCVRLAHISLRQNRPSPFARARASGLHNMCV
nr:hypothetical protein [Methylosinus sp. Ce-a6]